ncbi:MAG: NUDIX hydrolase [Lachnospiraceae bacterium]|nr:NUDIX hydrolase [Lachnospiraceae bacterium]
MVTIGDHMAKNSELISDYDSSLYEKMSVAVDLLVFTIEEDRLKLLMIEREEEPYAGQLALPGVFVHIDETLDAAAKRGIEEETGLKNIYFEQLYTFGEVKRDPRMRIISVSYMALVPLEKLTFKAGKRTKDAYLVDVCELLDSGFSVAFDHKEIIRYARWRLANKVEYTRIAFHLVPEEFTLPNLQKVYEILLGKPLYKANFRKKIAEYIEETEYQTSGDAHRPSRYYRLKKEYKEGRVT